LQKLIRANIDAVNGFKTSAEEVDEPAIAKLFRDLAEERASLATELQNHVTFNGEEAADDGSVAAAIHRTWIQVRSKLSSGDPAGVLAEAERGEDHIKAAYEDVIKETAGSALNTVLLEQYRIVKEGHDRVRNLRDTFLGKE
jgi:uncharacterized protein (TIGR02284 family)